jgi:uncharacterized protein YoxC
MKTKVMTAMKKLTDKMKGIKTDVEGTGLAINKFGHQVNDVKERVQKFKTTIENARDH